jgi:polycystin 2
LALLLNLTSKFITFCSDLTNGRYYWSSAHGRPYFTGIFGENYPGSGFILTFPGNATNVIDIANQLIQDNWIDGSTRVVVLEFSLFNVNLNIFSMVRIGIEVPASGEILPFYNINTVEAFK